MGIYTMGQFERSESGSATNGFEQEALFTEREVLEAQKPEVLEQIIADGYQKIYEIEKTIRLATEVYEGTTGREYPGAL